MKNKEIERSLFKITDLQASLESSKLENERLSKEVSHLNGLLAQSSNKFRTINTNFLEREKLYTSKESELLRTLSVTEEQVELMKQSEKNLNAQLELANKEIEQLKQKCKDYQLIVEENSSELNINQG